MMGYRSRKIISRLVLVAMVSAVASTLCASEWPAPRPLDPERLRQAGLRVIRSEHATIVTDLRSSSEVDRLAEVVDCAVPLWKERFDTPAKVASSWQLRIYLMGERERFASLELLPEQNKTFTDGYAYGYEAWVVDQTSDYYRRHLVLHEGTHAWMMTTLGGCGPAWHMEGVAELCGTHEWNPAEATLRLATMPSSREAVPYWGRIALVRDRADSQGVISFRALSKLDNRNALATSSYAWLWAWAKFLDAHPHYQARWRALGRTAGEKRFDRRFAKAFAEDALRIKQEWNLFAARLTYGHDIEREAITFRPGELLGDDAKRAIVLADRGWQSSGVRVEKGDRIEITARGRFTVHVDASEQSWPCEPGGVTLRYHAGRPLGELLMSVNDQTARAFLVAQPVGLGRSWTADRAGTLYFRVNDLPNELAENRGAIQIEIQRSSD